MQKLIIARKDLNMSPGKLAAQVSHASMAFLSTMIKETAKPMWKYETLPAVMINPEINELTACSCGIRVLKDVYEDCFVIFTQKLSGRHGIRIT